MFEFRQWCFKNRLDQSKTRSVEKTLFLGHTPIPHKNLKMAETPCEQCALLNNTMNHLKQVNHQMQADLSVLHKRSMEVSELEIQLREAYDCINAQQLELNKCATVGTFTGLDALMQKVALREKNKHYQLEMKLKQHIAELTMFANNREMELKAYFDSRESEFHAFINEKDACSSEQLNQVQMECEDNLSSFKQKCDVFEVNCESEYNAKHTEFHHKINELKCLLEQKTTECDFKDVKVKQLLCENEELYKDILLLKCIGEKCLRNEDELNAIITTLTSTVELLEKQHCDGMKQLVELHAKEVLNLHMIMVESEMSRS